MAVSNIIYTIKLHVNSIFHQTAQTLHKSSLEALEELLICSGIKDKSF